MEKIYITPCIIRKSIIKYRLRGMIFNRVISNFSKNSRDAWMRNVINWELCKRPKFNPANKWQINESDSVQEM